MINSITSFFTNLRRKLFVWRIESEIFGRLFPHLNHERDHGYLFDSDEEFRAVIDRLGKDAKSDLEAIERAAREMPKAYGEAFRYIAYRDLGRDLAMYRRLACRRTQPKSCDPRFIATSA